MILADTSVWIHHLRNNDRRLAEHLIDGQITTHEYIIAELACGNLAQRDIFLREISSLRLLSTVTIDEVLQLIQLQQLMGKGLGFVDISLLASCLLTDSLLWTRDKRLLDTANNIGCAYVI
ncbi:MAG TPA: VapC toxin family PIN domain ribonuclease [Phycisphaerales bacterium]|nr:VapC toxin family PIN domain ribonuclease [Phycisphaerales bacterium]HCD34434.1 VapC toxin family PIN domain ribonuclease [Phycisphaerales bacterium]|tara:strand:- start:586 stop:948 length:363 start_codon:yes stop_codon:yes gene_type:complete